jgi:hypothetical protein
LQFSLIDHGSRKAQTKEKEKENPPHSYLRKMIK